MLLKDFDCIVAFGKKGDYYFSDKYTKIGIMWGDDWLTQLVVLPINQNNKNYKETSWDWNGDIDCPTLSPSILVSETDNNGNKKELWHGYLQGGKLVDV